MNKSQIKYGRKEWDFQIARSVGSLKTAWALAIIEAAVILLLVFYMGSYMQKPKLVPYVVTIQGDQVSFQGVMRSTKLTINDAVVRNYIIRFVSNLRTVSSDTVVLKKNLFDTYQIATPGAQRQISEEIAQTKPFEASNHDIRDDVQFTVFEKIAEKTWRAEWIEQIRQQGNLKDTISMVGTFTYVQGFPETEQQAERNPFGLYISEFFISQRRQ